MKEFDLDVINRVARRAFAARFRRALCFVGVCFAVLRVTVYGVECKIRFYKLRASKQHETETMGDI